MKCQFLDIVVTDRVCLVGGERGGGGGEFYYCQSDMNTPNIQHRCKLHV